jgi:cytokinin riboside 5'-monophosphate phosphoribohydrolase
MIHNVTVYCSSSKSLSPRYYDAGASLGRAIAREHWNLIYGGNAIGLMKTVADAARSGGGKVIGITPQIFVDEGCHDQLCEELVITQTMRERKSLLEERGDAFIALPGGIGTMEELLEIIAGKALKYHNKPIVLLNIDGYWNPLLGMFSDAVEHGFAKSKHLSLYHVAPNVEDAIEHLLNHTPENTAGK